MTRKALLVGVDDYGNYAERLSAPVYEVQQWKDLLSKRPYRFDEITTLPNGKATRENVLSELRRLLHGAQRNDQLLFYFAGHGSISRASGTGAAEQSLIVSGPDLQSASIRETDIKKIFEKYRPPRGTDITFVLDCCHSAGYGDLLLHKIASRGGNVATTAIPLFAPPPVDLVTNVRSMRMFGEFAERGSDTYETPVILAATGEYNAAYEIPHDGRRRMLFTMRLLGWLARTRDTFVGIRDNINPLHPDYDQKARLGGNQARWEEKFPGEASVDDADEPLTESLSTDETQALATLNVRVMGIACFANARPENAPYKARIILPYDEGQWVPPEDIHYACLEIASEDFHGLPKGPLAAKARQYERAGVEYNLWHLDGYTVTIQTGDPDQPFHRTQEFHDHVPKMTVLAPELRPYDPDPSCFEPAPLLDRFAAFVNLPGGEARVGTLRQRSTVYERRHSGKRTFGPVNTPLSVSVHVRVVTDYPTIVLRPYLDDTREDLVVELRPGATILVANARFADIMGEVAGDIPREQFLLFYKLAPAEPPDPPLPRISTVPVDDCTVTDWP